MPPLSLNFSNVQFTHEKVNHVIPKLYVVDKLFDGIEYLLGNNWPPTPRSSLTGETRWCCNGHR